MRLPAVASLPETGIARALVLRTARLKEVQWVVDHLRDRYPGVEIGVVGTELDHPAFESCRHFALTGQWLNPRTFAPLAAAVRRWNPELVVMCLNGDAGPSYDGVSRVMKRIPAAHRLVATFDHRWMKWRHSYFSNGSYLTCALLDVVELMLAPAIWLYVLLTPSGPRYMPEGQGRKAPGYGR